MKRTAAEDMDLHTLKISKIEQNTESFKYLPSTTLPGYKGTGPGQAEQQH